MSIRPQSEEQKFTRTIYHPQEMSWEILMLILRSALYPRKETYKLNTQSDSVKAKLSTT